MFAGKYLNRYGLDDSGGLAHVPPGWTHWRALKGNSVFYNYSVSVDGVEERHGSSYEDDYLTDVIGRKAEAFLTQERNSTSPFFMCLSTTAPHRPATPAPQHAHAFSGYGAPRDDAFDVYPGPTKHWMTRMSPEHLSSRSVSLIDKHFRNRWRSLLSVDDMVERVVSILDKQVRDLHRDRPTTSGNKTDSHAVRTCPLFTLQGVLDNTYLVFTSDHGFHLGQFGLPFDMRQPYEFDIKVPLAVAGPGIYLTLSHKKSQYFSAPIISGITKDTVITAPVVNVDFAPTFLDMAGVRPSASMDGVSFLPLATGKAAGGVGREFLVEYVGEGGHVNIDSECALRGLDTGDFYDCFEDFGCKCADAMNNTYNCIRKIRCNSFACSCEIHS